MQEHSLVRSWVRERDPEAFRALCDRYAGLVFTASLRVLRNAADAEEVTQECFLRLARTTREFQGSTGAWLHRVAVNLSIDRIRADSARRDRESRYVEATKLEAELAWDDISSHVDAALNALPHKIRNTVVGHFIEGRSHQDLANDEGVSRAAITQRIQRALPLVREELGHRGVVVPLALLTAWYPLKLSQAESVPVGLVPELGKLCLLASTSQPLASGAFAAALSLKGIAVLLMTVATLGVAGFAIFRPLQTAEQKQPRDTPVASTARHESPHAPAAVLPAATESSGQTEAPAPASASAPQQPAGATISGYVREKDSFRPLEGVGLVCQPDSGKDGFNYSDEDIVYTDADGRYQVSGLGAGPYKVMCHPQWQTQDAGDTEKYQVELKFAGNVSFQHFDVTGNDPQAGPDFEVILGTTISGQVLDLAGNPLPGADVRLSTPNLDVDIHLKSGEGGFFKAGGIPASSSVYLTASRGSVNSLLREESGLQKVAPPEADALVSGPLGPLSLGAEGLSGVNVTVRPGGTISGRLFDATGRPLANTHIMARAIDAPDFIGSRFETTVEDGTFLLAGLSGGTYSLAWNPQKAGVSEEDYGWTPSEALELKRVDLAWGKNLENLRLQAARPQPVAGGARMLRGRVTDQHHRPVSGAGIWLREGFSTRGQRGDSRHDGTFKIMDLKDDTAYTLEISHHEYTKYVEENMEIGPEPLEIMLQGLGSISGRVIDAGTGASLTAFTIGTQFSQVPAIFVSDDEGRFRIEGAFAGENQVFASASGYAESRTPVLVTPDRETAGVLISLDQGYTIAGMVADDDGLPIVGALIYTQAVPEMDSERETMARGRTGEDGRFTLENLPLAEGGLWAWAPGHAAGSTRFDTTTKEVSITLSARLGTVSGEILRAGKPTQARDVSLFSDDFTHLRPLHSSVRPTPEGVFRFVEVPEGVYNCIAYQETGTPGNVRNIAKEVVVEAGKETRVILDLPEGDASVYGRVSYGKGAPIDGHVLLKLSCPSGNQVRYAQLSAEGDFMIDALPSAEAVLTVNVVTEAPYASVSRELPLSIVENESVHQDVHFDGLGSIQGQVLNGPARNMTVFLVPGQVSLTEATASTLGQLNRRALAQTLTEDNGAYRMSGLSPGAYTVVAYSLQPDTWQVSYAMGYCVLNNVEEETTLNLQLQE